MMEVNSGSYLALELDFFMDLAVKELREPFCQMLLATGQPA